MDALSSMFSYVTIQRVAKCELLGPFAILVQSSLGAIAVISLFYKRHIEIPRRPFKVWFFDVSKQLSGAVVIHFLNIAMSADNDYGTFKQKTSPCTWYFLNVLLDTTIGVGLIWLFLRTLAAASNLLKLEGTDSGVYGSPPRWNWWFKQATIYTIGLAMMKLVVFIVLSTVPQLSILGNFLLKWSAHHEKSRIFFVMFFFPLVMNVVQYVIIDNIVMSRRSTQLEHDSTPQSPTPCPDDRQPSDSGKQGVRQAQVGQDTERTTLIHE